MSNSSHIHTAVIPYELLLNAYRSGYFPMADSRDGEIGWYSPDPRAIIPLDTFHIPRSLTLIVKRNPFEIRINTAFEEVIRACSEREDTWISGQIMRSYANLYELGYGHSVECWSKNELVGGLYGVAIGGAFFGESMFSRKRDASKVALVSLVERLNSRGFELLDTQFITPHLARFGTVEISRKEYLALLKKAVVKPCSFIE